MSQQYVRQVEGYKREMRTDRGWIEDGRVARLRRLVWDGQTDRQTNVQIGADGG